MNESARKMSELARQIFDGKIEYDEAIEFIGYNTVRSLPYYGKFPIIVYGISEV